MSSEWQLAEQFFKSDIERIQNPDYFMKNFQCPELIKYFGEVISIKQINERRDAINVFYDRFISMTELNKTLYLQLKWILVMHGVIQSFKQNTPLFGYTFKALQVCIEGYSSFQASLGPYEQYLSVWLVKPYLQYLCKLCLLNMPDETVKYDESLQTKAEQQYPSENSTKQVEALDNINSKLIDWYRKFNFVVSTLETFQKILGQTQRYFNLTYPFLTNIGKLMIKDLNIWIFKLKYNYRSLKKLNVTIIELDQIQTKIKLFSKNYNGCLQSSLENSGAKNNDYYKQDLKDFLQSPLKPIQVKLMNKISIDSPLSAFLKY